MKKLLGIVVLGLLWCNVGVAEMRLIEEKTMKGKEFNYTIATVCIDNYKFVLARRHGSNSIVQFFKPGPYDKWPSEPEKC